MKDLSIVIPVYNGANSINALVESLHAELKSFSFEIVLVNDGSRDASAQVCTELAKKHSGITFINLRKNFGEFNAVMCGLNYVSGKYAVIIDDDFQNPPSEIEKLYSKAEEEDYDVVYSYYDEKKHHWFRNLGSQIINTLTTYLLKKPKNLYLSSFKLIKKEVVDEIVKSKTPHPYIDGLIFQITNNVGREKVLHLDRKEGASNYTVSKLISLTLTIIFGYSLIPLRLTLLAGLSSIAFSLFYMILYAFEIIYHWGSPIIIFMCGVILCALALLGEYVGKSFLILSGKPQFVIRSVVKKEEN
jgi:glycosyltransferase involved in cell wall biosynthesis